MLVSRFRVLATATGKPAQIVLGDESRSIPMTDVRAAPVPIPGQAEGVSWVANSPLRNIGFAVPTDLAGPFVVGYEFDVPLLPAGVRLEVSCMAHLIFVPEIGACRPAEIAVKAGDTVTFVALSSTPREVVSIPAGWTTGPLSQPPGPGPASYDHVFTTPGDYPFAKKDAPLLKGVVHVL